MLWPGGRKGKREMLDCIGSAYYFLYQDIYLTPGPKGPDLTENVRMNIYVGNLSYDATEDGLKKIFEEHGQVESAKIIIDRYTNRSRGFGFVEMPNDEEGQAAIEALNGAEMDGRNLKVNEARPRAER